MIEITNVSKTFTLHNQGAAVIEVLTGVTLSAPLIYARSRFEDDAVSQPNSNKMFTIVGPTRGTSRASLSVVNGVG